MNTQQEKWVENELRNILIELTDAMDYLDSPEQLTAFIKAKKAISSLLLQARKEAREETLREVINILNYPGADADYNVQKIFDLLNEQEARRLCDVDTCEGHNQYEVITW